MTPNGSGGEYIEFNHPDRLGTRLVTNQAGGTAYEQVHLPFGTALNAESTLTTNNKRFTSYDRSAQTGLDYAINRTYDSKQGRFTQIDPIGMSSVDFKDPQTLNLYSYCGNDPINYIDPDGLFFGKLFRWIGKFIKWLAVAVAIAVTVIAIVVMPALLPILGPTFFAKLFIATGTMIASAFAPPKIGAILGILSGMILTGPGIIVNFAATVDKMAKWEKVLAATNFVGAVANSFAKGKKKKYKTAQDAAIAFLQRVNARSIRINREIATFICKLKDKTFTTGRDQVLGPTGGSPVNDCPKDSQLAGIAHTHARWSQNSVINGVDYNELFSSADKSWNVPNWVATPSGDIHRWNPDTGLFATVSKLKGVGRTKIK